MNNKIKVVRRMACGYRDEAYESSVHRDRLKTLRLPHHRVHDSRHFYAVSAVRAGTSYELVARQLGHADVQMVARVYGIFAPRSDERDRWEKIADAQDAEREAAKKLKKPTKWVPLPVPHPRTTRANHR